MELAEILMRKTKIHVWEIVTVTDVELTSDLRIGRIFVTTGPDEKLIGGRACRSDEGGRLYSRRTGPPGQFAVHTGIDFSEKYDGHSRRSNPLVAE